ncbi:MAG: glycosyltransferase family 2 protein [Lachnospiraceae bacterium]|nr:glycosyltransferase family 2 protein [Lachnospiraceae bacterium]
MLLTVFTPTYNRKELLKRAYASLKEQTCIDFVWIIVDDGSSDGTEETVRGFAAEGKICIEYHFQNNGGKMRAHNRGVEYCRTPWFLCLDSDDVLVPDAVEQILKCIKATEEYEQAAKPDEINKVNSSRKTEVAGIIAHKGKSETELLSGVDFPKEYLDAGRQELTTLYDLYLKGFRGETTLVFKTEILREFPFPEINGEKYVPEDYIYDKIDSEYKYFVLPRILTVCEIVSEGYTDSVRRLKEDNKQAWYLYYEQRARITPMSLLKLKYLGFYRLYARLTGHALKEADGISLWDKILGIPGEIFLLCTGKM